MVKQKKVKSKKKDTKTKNDPLNVFDSARVKAVDGKTNDLSRDELIRKDKLKFAKRYEAINLFDESIKYYKQLEMDDEVERVTAKKVELYRTKAREFEAEGRYIEAAELYDRLDMTDRAARLRKKDGGAETMPPPLDLEDRTASDANEALIAKNPQASRALRWEMPNVEMDDVGSEPLDTASEPDAKLADEQQHSNKSVEMEKPLSEIARSEIAWDEEDEPGPVQAVQTGSEKPAEAPPGSKTFNICPFCGEELNLPKQPKFCPYCKEAFQ